MSATLAFALPALVSLGLARATDGADADADTDAHLRSWPELPLGGAAGSLTTVGLLLLVGVLMVATALMRTRGLQRASSSAVATLLYTESQPPQISNPGPTHDRACQ